MGLGALTLHLIESDSLPSLLKIIVIPT
jgi:hypothetical protein